MAVIQSMKGIPIVEIDKAFGDFDLNAKLSKKERRMLGEVIETKYRADIAERAGIAVELKDLEEDQFATTELVAPGEEGSYNALYAHYLKCQAIGTLVAFSEGWQAFEEVVLNTYVRARRKENNEFRGDDPNRAFSLRIRQQEAEDFLKYIKSEIVAAAQVPKPVLK